MWGSDGSKEMKRRWSVNDGDKGSSELTEEEERRREREEEGRGKGGVMLNGTIIDRSTPT